MTNWNLSLKKVENTLFRGFFIKYPQILDFEKKAKTRKIITKTPNYGHHTFEKMSQKNGFVKSPTFYERMCRTLIAYPTKNVGFMGSLKSKSIPILTQYELNPMTDIRYVNSNSIIPQITWLDVSNYMGTSWTEQHKKISYDHFLIITILP